MVPTISMSIVIFAVVSVVQSIPMIEDHIMVPETEELSFPAGSVEGDDHKFPTSYQSFHLESKDPVPLIVKKKYLPVMAHVRDAHELQQFFGDQDNFFNAQEAGFIKLRR